MKWVTLVLLGALAYVHFYLWLDGDGWFRKGDLQAQLAKLQADNQEATQRNAELKAELKDLHAGGDALGELARFELDYIGRGETFYRVVPRLIGDSDSAAEAE